MKICLNQQSYKKISTSSKKINSIIRKRGKKEQYQICVDFFRSFAFVTGESILVAFTFYRSMNKKLTKWTLEKSFSNSQISTLAKNYTNLRTTIVCFLLHHLN